MIYTYDDLVDKTAAELMEIKQAKLDELAEVKKQKNIIICNILSLQGMIKTESHGIQEGEADDN